MAPFALLFLSGGLALFWAVPFAISRRLSGGILAFAGLWTLGEFARSTVLTGFPWAFTNTDTVVRLVQPNAPQHLKWHPEYVRKFFERQIDAARPAKVILGATREEGGSLFNSAVVLDEAGQLEHVYDKHHLVPFGEFLPFPSFFEH